MKPMTLPGNAGLAGLDGALTMALPNLIVAGAPKCGTSSLFQWIADHPAAEGSAIKETCYFADPESHVFNPESNFGKGGLAGYEAHFPVSNPDALIRLEATPTYIYQQTAITHLPGLATHPKFIFVLREPASQILSTYRYFSNNWTYLSPDVSFQDFIQMAEAGDPKLQANELLADALANVRYLEHLNRWREAVGSERMLVLALDRFVTDQTGAMKHIADWLGLDPAFYDDYAFPRENETYQVKNRMLHAANIRLRGLVAKTPLYERVRSAYRRLNTTSAPAPLLAADEAALTALRLQFQPDNQALAEAFNLDLSRWAPKQAA